MRRTLPSLFRARRHAGIDLSSTTGFAASPDGNGERPRGANISSVGDDQPPGQPGADGAPSSTPDPALARTFDRTLDELAFDWSGHARRSAISSTPTCSAGTSSSR
jgi:hypothetical protein